MQPDDLLKIERTQPVAVVLTVEQASLVALLVKRTRDRCEDERNALSSFGWNFAGYESQYGVAVMNTVISKMDKAIQEVMPALEDKPE